MSISHIPALQGERVTVRVLTRVDADGFIAAAVASEQLHAPWTSAPRDLAAFEAYLARRGETFVPLGVFHRPSGAIVGVFNISQIYMGPFCSAYLGYYAFAPHARRGYMQDGLQLTLRLAFGHFALHRIEANIQPANQASIALVRRAGFVREGFSEAYLYIDGAWRDHERWAMRLELMPKQS